MKHNLYYFDQQFFLHQVSQKEQHFLEGKCKSHLTGLEVNQLFHYYFSAINDELTLMLSCMQLLYTLYIASELGGPIYLFMSALSKKAASMARVTLVVVNTITLGCLQNKNVQRRTCNHALVLILPNTGLLRRW